MWFMETSRAPSAGRFWAQAPGRPCVRLQPAASSACNRSMLLPVPLAPQAGGSAPLRKKLPFISRYSSAGNAPLPHSGGRGPCRVHASCACQCASCDTGCCKAHSALRRRPQPLPLHMQIWVRELRNGDKSCCKEGQCSTTL